MAPLACVSQYSRDCGRAMLDPVWRVDCNWMDSSESSTHLAFSLINDSNEMQPAIFCRPTERFSTFAEGLHRRLPPPSPAARKCEKSAPSARQAHSAPLDKKDITGPPGPHNGMNLAVAQVTICDIWISKGTATGECSDSPMQMWRGKKKNSQNHASLANFWGPATRRLKLLWHMNGGKASAFFKNKKKKKKLKWGIVHNLAEIYYKSKLPSDPHTDTAKHHMFTSKGRNAHKMWERKDPSEDWKRESVTVSRRRPERWYRGGEEQREGGNIHAPGPGAAGAHTWKARKTGTKV